MRIFQFIDEYCKDLVEEHNQQKKFIDLSEYIHDDVISDADGNLVPVIYIDGNPVPIKDILSMHKDDFIHAYNYPSSALMYDSYLQNFEIFEGKEVLSMVRDKIKSTIEKLQEPAPEVECMW